MDDTQTLELQLKTTVQNAISKMDELTEKLSKVNSATGKAKSSVDKFSKAFVSLGTFSGIKRLTRQFLEWTNLSIDFTEQLNLFNVVFGNIEKNGVKTFSTLGKKATQFQNQMNEAFGTNKTETLKYQALFQSMGENVGIPDSYSALMSETMTKLTYDLASLYNKSESTTGEALRAGVYAGQTKPLRSYGIDVTQTSMQPILNSLGITDRSVKQMSQAEKEILRYIATLKQAQIAMGDMANTIESPSNQLKVFKQQLVESKVALTSLFIGGFANILPYANAILMVVKELSKAIASFFGIELTDYNSAIASTEDAYSGIGESIDDATGKAKKFKREIMGFDQVHNINENDDSGSGSGASGGIDKRLLDAITGYDNGMDKVRMKATEIRDKIMEWLGFHKKINPLTGETYFEYQGIGKTLKNIWESFKGLSTEGKIIAGVVGILAGYKIFSSVTKIAKALLGTDNVLKLNGSKLTLLGKTVKSLKVSGWATTIGKIGSKLKVVATIGLKVVGVIGSLVAVIGGSAGAYQAVKKLTKGTEDSGKQMKNLGISMVSATAGGAGLGAIIGGPLGAGIGALTGLVISGTSAFLGYNKAIKELAKEELFGNLNLSVEEWTEILNSSSPIVSDFSAKHQDLKSKISALNDTFVENANNLDLVNYKYAVLGQQISEDTMTTITDSVNGMCTATTTAIQENTDFQLQLWGDFFTQRGTLNDEENQNFLKKIIASGDNQKTELKNTQDNITNTYKNAIETRGYLTNEEYNYIQTQLNKIKELTQQQMSQSHADIIYWKSKMGKDSLAIDEESYKNLKTALSTYEKEQNDIIAENYTIRLNSLNSLLDSKEISESEYNKRLKEINNQRAKDYEEVDEYIAKVLAETTEGLKVKYKELENDTSKSAKEQKKIIKSIFEDLEIDTSVLDTEVKKAATSVNTIFSRNLNRDYPLRVGLDTNKLQADLKLVNKSLGTNYCLPRADGGAFYGGSWHDIQQYANGGIPSHGSMFVAGERGAEIVGHINGRTEVLNQSQIASTIYSAMVSAMSQFGGQSNQIDVHVHTDEGTVIDRINQRTKQTGICPINV